ncbi:hypothetical protein KSX_80640 [Ktedonospora formicarum]|uniref:Transposase n=1 Tax=Ktedonospora formicarum TaxID=2778364 RepID=A0A8J3MXE6_9CHLR|nr:hypothetical protein KSX_80640 [Ktedonospora formicarum]
MLKNGKLSKAISDVGWSEFVSQLGYKADWYGRTLVKIERGIHPASAASRVGMCSTPYRLRSVTGTAPSVGCTMTVIRNAAKNIVAAGQAILACGEAVRPERVPSRLGKPQRSRKPSR